MDTFDRDVAETQALAAEQPVSKRQAEHLATIVDRARGVLDAERGLHLAVRAAREDSSGPSWAMIGAALGIGRREACERFSAPPPRP